MALRGYDYIKHNEALTCDVPGCRRLRQKGRRGRWCRRHGLRFDIDNNELSRLDIYGYDIDRLAEACAIYMSQIIKDNKLRVDYIKPEQEYPDYLEPGKL